MAKIADYFAFAFETFSHRPTRSWLTILGILIGIAAVVSLIALGQGLYSMVEKQFQQLGADKVIISPGAGTYGPLTGVIGNERFTDHDLDVVADSRGVEKAIGLSSFLVKTEKDDELKYTFAIGYDPSKITVGEVQGGVEILSGRELRSGDKYKAMVGYRIGNGEFYKKEVRVGDTIYLQDTKIEVVGIVNEIGNRQDDTQIYVPIETAKELYKQPGYTMMWAVAKKGFNPSDVAEYIKNDMRRDRGLKKGAEDFTATTTEQLISTFNDVMLIVQAVIIGIAAISLVVGGIGIMNTMYTAVLERTREIGVMKAIGARNSDVMMIFLIESGILGLAGGAAGTLLGMGAGKLVEAVAAQARTNLVVSFPLWLIGGALAFSFIIGSLSGTLPALNAARMKPTDALRYE